MGDPEDYEPPGGNTPGALGYDPNGILRVADRSDNFVSTVHRVIVVCDSHRKPLARMTGYRPASSGRGRRRGPCPGCGRGADIVIVNGDGEEL